MSEKERVLQLPSSKYKDIVKKAKETRNSREKSLNSSQDASFDAFRKRRKKTNLSQSFVMRQTIALSTKNKQLVNSLTQSKLLAAELEKSLRIMQEKFMTLIMKLNSTEVAFGRCKQELDVAKELLQGKEGLYRNLRSQLQSLLDTTAEMDGSFVAMKDLPTVMHSNLPQRVALAKKRYSSVTPKSKNKKWKPELEMVEETGHTESAAVSLAAEENLQIAAEETLLADAPTSPLLNNETSFTSPSPMVSPKEWVDSQPGRSPMHSEVLGHSIEFSPKRLNKRRTTTAPSYFDSDDSLSDVEHEEDTPVTGSPQFVLALDDVGEDLFDSDDQVPLEGKATPCNEAAAVSPDSFVSGCGSEADRAQDDSDSDYVPIIHNTKSCSKMQTKVSRERKVSSSTDHHNADNTDHSIISMDLTAPNESEIVVTKKKTKPKQPRKKKIKEPKKKSKKKKDETLVKSDMDVFNCSNDSFVVNPGKKIQLSLKDTEENGREKTRSLPMLNITNVMAGESEPSGRRRRTCISYAEPNLRKKIRRGDKFFHPS